MTRVRTHPGEVLFEEFMQPLGLSARALGSQIGISPNRISEIVRARRGVSADTAIRLSRWSGTSAQFWLNLQDAYAISEAESEHDYSNIKSRGAA
jgi:antitoxin HigA-1